MQVLPLDKYEGHDIVLWGERSLVEAGDIQGATTINFDLYCPQSEKYSSGSWRLVFVVAP